jgi:aldehyde:ferredoxin oxidoreductase
MPGCPIRCKQTYLDIKGDPITSGFEYETIVMMGSNCGIDDLDNIARMSKICDDLGIDTIEMGAAVAIAMEAGIIPFGDSEAAISMLNSNYDGTTIGRVIGNGAEITSRVFCVRRVPTVKGQSLAAYDPRSNKGIGVTYASSPMGADHTAGCVMPGRKGFEQTKEYNLLKAEGQETLSIDIQIMVAVIDAVGLCFFAGLDTEMLQRIVALHNAKYGSKLKFPDLVKMGKDTLKIEHQFNLAAGILPVLSLPDFFEEEPLTPYQTVFDVGLGKISIALKEKLSLGELSFGT